VTAPSLEHELDAVVAEAGFSGVVRVDRRGHAEIERAYGLAHRGLGVPNEFDTRFALASGTKGFTALTVVSLVEEGLLELATPARSLLADDLALGAILGLAMVINMFIAATAGTLIPLGLRAMKVDPALASSVFITTLTDVFGFLSFLGLATVFLRFLHSTPASLLP